MEGKKEGRSKKNNFYYYSSFVFNRKEKVESSMFLKGFIPRDHVMK